MGGCFGRWFVAAMVAIAAVAIEDSRAETVNAGERDAVIWLNGCTGFVVEGNLLVTAKHCEHPEAMAVTLQGRTVQARRVYVHSGKDGPVVFRLEGGPYEGLPVARQMPQVGDKVYSLGYPGGNWARIEGEITGGDGRETNYTNHRVATGNSGGPLLNAAGEVIGVTLWVDTNIAKHESGFSGWSVTYNAIASAAGKGPAPAVGGGVRTQVVAFSRDNCGPCEQLDADVLAGHFAAYDFLFVHYHQASKQWDQPEIYAEFVKACQPDDFAFPTIWIRGTNQYRVGYATARRGGVLGWIAGVVRHLADGIFGRPERSQPIPLPPVAEGVPFAERIEPQPEDSAVRKLANDLAALKDHAEKTATDLKTFKESGVVGKIRAIARLKSDKNEALSQVESIRGDLAAVKQDFREQPVQFLWGLLGMVSGLVHRRFA